MDLKSSPNLPRELWLTQFHLTLLNTGLTVPVALNLGPAIQGIVNALAGGAGGLLTLSGKYEYYTPVVLAELKKKKNIPPPQWGFFEMSKEDTFLPISKELIRYTRKISRCDENKVLSEFYEQAKLHEKAIMVAAVEEAKFFQLLLKLISAKRCLEIGVFLGYTTCALAQALPRDQGLVVGLEISEEFSKVGYPYWERAGVRDNIRMIYGDASKTLVDVVVAEYGNDSFDFVFIDADKENYVHYLTHSMMLVREGGIIAVDNTLYSGKVLDENTTDTRVQGIRKANQVILELDPEKWEISCLPFADGVTLITKLKK